MKLATKTDIVKQVKILDLANQFNIGLESASAGNFDYRCKCPAPDHKHGKEKTPSLYINTRDNNFYCYGCNRGVSCIDFYMMCADKSFAEAIQEMRPMVKSPGTYQDVVDQKRAVTPILISSSEIIRSFLISNPEKIDDLTPMLKKLDGIYFDSSKEDAELFERINLKIKKILRS
jgi:DNA primase